MKRRPDKHDSAEQKDKPSAADAEVEYFTNAMADVVRLAPDPRGRVHTARHISAPRPTASSTSPSCSDEADESLEDGFAAPGVDRRELRKLTRGDHVAGRRLDLHGMTAAEAVASVKRFIDASRHGCRCVCIVHGRGLHSEGNISVLKTRVRECLRRHRAVLAYADAPRASGGTGAVYVLIRK